MVGWASRHPELHARAGEGLLRDLLRAQQPDGRPGRRLRAGAGEAAARALLRPHPARARRRRRRSSRSSRSSSARSASTPRPRRSPTVRIWWHGVPLRAQGPHALDLLSDVLSGRTGRLYKGLVLGRQVANEAGASVDLKKYDGSFSVEAVVKDGKDPQDVETAVYEEIARLQKEHVPAEELQKVKNQAKANAYRRLSSPVFIMFQLLVYEGLGDWKYINTYADEVDTVTAADLQRVAVAVPEPREPHRRASSRARRVRRPRTRSSRRSRRRRRRSRARACSRSRPRRDPEKLREGLAQLEQGLAGAPAEVKPALDAHPETRQGAAGRARERKEVNAMKTLCLAVTLAAAAPVAFAQPIPANPDQLKFEPISYTPPKAADHRVVLKNGMVVYVVEDPTLPLVNIALTVRTGTLPGARRQGGPRRLHRRADPPRRHQIADRGAARREARLPGRQAGTGIGDTAGSASLELSVGQPRPGARGLRRDAALPALPGGPPGAGEGAGAAGDEEAQRRLVRHRAVRVERAALPARSTTRTAGPPRPRSSHHARGHGRVPPAYFQPANMIAAVSGVLQARRHACASWRRPSPTGRRRAWRCRRCRPSSFTAAPGLYRMNKDVNQGRVSIGLPAVKRDHPGHLRARGDERDPGRQRLHLAHHARPCARTRGSPTRRAPASRSASTRRGRSAPPSSRRAARSPTRRSSCSARSRSCARRRSPAEELKTIKDNLIATFPSQFASKAQTVGIFASDEYTKRDPAFWQTYRDRIRGRDGRRRAAGGAGAPRARRR